MLNHPTDDKAFVKTACSLAIALLTIGMGVNSSWAGLDQPSGLKSTPISTNAFSLPNASHGRLRWSTEMPPLPAAASGIMRLHTTRYAQAPICGDEGSLCGSPGQLPCCAEARFCISVLGGGTPRTCYHCLPAGYPCPSDQHLCCNGACGVGGTCE
jgi:hypothetical protein